MLQFFPSLLASLYALKPPVWLCEHFLKYREVYRAARSNPDAVLGGIVQVLGGGDEEQRRLERRSGRRWLLYQFAA